MKILSFTHSKIKFNFDLTFVLTIVYQVYDPYSNTCKTLASDIVSINEINSILHGTQDNRLGSNNKTKKSYRLNIRCHHGNLDGNKESCVCHDGWNSAQNLSFPIVSTVPIHMCTIKTHSKIMSKYLPMMGTLDSKISVSFLHGIVYIIMH